MDGWNKVVSKNLYFLLIHTLESTEKTFDPLCACSAHGRQLDLSGMVTFFSGKTGQQVLNSNLEMIRFTAQVTMTKHPGKM